MRKWAAAFALASAATSTACEAKDADYLTVETISVPFDGMKFHSNPNEPYRQLVRSLRDRAAKEAGDDKFQAVMDGRHWGPRGQRQLISAVTPSKGVFYFTEYGPDHEVSGGGATVTKRRDRLNVCRFTVDWEKLPGGPYAPGLLWVGRAFPSIDCKPPPAEEVARLAEQRRQSERASYRIEAAGSTAGLKAAVVREEWRLGDHGPKPPLDVGRAIETVLGKAGQLASAVPVSHDIPAYARTRSGRQLFALAEQFEQWQQRTCVVEGLGWADVASGIAHPKMTAARKLCNQLFDEGEKRYIEELREKAKTSPIVVKPVSN